MTILTFQEDPEEGGQLDISQEHVYQAYLDYNFWVLRVYHVLEKWVDFEFFINFLTIFCLCIKLEKFWQDKEICLEMIHEIRKNRGSNTNHIKLIYQRSFHIFSINFLKKRVEWEGWLGKIILGFDFRRVVGHRRAAEALYPENILQRIESLISFHIISFCSSLLCIFIKKSKTFYHFWLGTNGNF